MVMLNSLALVLAQNRTETGKTDDASPLAITFITLILVGFIVAAVLIRRARRAHGDPPAGSVPTSDVPEHLRSGGMSKPATAASWDDSGRSPGPQP